MGISTHSLTKRLTHGLGQNIRTSKFQLTASRRGWQKYSELYEKARIFQLTASRRGWQQVVEQIHVVSDISTHSLTKRLTNRNPETYCSKIFQLTASRRGWLSFSEYFWLTRIFQLTASRRGWPAKNDGEHTLDAFQLTASRRGWPWCRTLKRTQMYFNSQPHEEADSRHSLRCGVELFQLTASRRGWRHRRCTVKLYGTISTHSLTKRLTSLT